MTVAAPGTYKPADKDLDQIDRLITKYGGVIGDAERAAGVSCGFFSRVRTGRVSVTDFMRLKVQGALERGIESPPKERPTPMLKFDIPDTCPPLLARLLQHVETRQAAKGVLKCSDGTLAGVMAGKPMPAAWVVKAKVVLGLPVIGGQSEEAPAPSALPEKPIPELVPWDGKKRISIQLNPRDGSKKGRTVKVPEPLGRLIVMHDNNLSKAAATMGHTSGVFGGIFADPKKFGMKWQQKVHRALHGLPPEGAPTMGEDYDKYQTGFAIVWLSATTFDRIRDLADILNGQVIFKRNTKAGWIIIYRMAPEDLPKFKRLGLRDAHEIVCP